MPPKLINLSQRPSDSTRKSLCDLKILALILVVFSGILVASKYLTPTTGLSEVTENIWVKSTWIDYSGYWSAWRLICQSANPYDSASYLTYLQYERPDDLLMFNPPWAVLFVSFTAWLPLSTGANIWLLMNSLLILCAGRLAVPLHQRVPPWVLLAACVFGPVALCLHFGQFSIILAFAISGLWYSLLSKRYMWSGACLTLITLKPHCFFLLIPVILIWGLLNRKWSLFIGGLFSFGWALLATTILSPNATGYWLESLNDGQALTRVSTTLASWIRLWQFSLTGYLPHWPITVIPGISLCALFCWLIKIRCHVCWQKHFFPLVFLSFLLSPYGWSYDHSVFVVAQVLFYYQTTQLIRLGKPFLKSLLVPLSVQCFWFLQISFFTKDLHYFTWLPLAYLIMWYWLRPDRQLSPHPHAA
jgi:hypothetical protein